MFELVIPAAVLLRNNCYLCFLNWCCKKIIIYGSLLIKFGKILNRRSHQVRLIHAAARNRASLFPAAFPKGLCRMKFRFNLAVEAHRWTPPPPQPLRASRPPRREHSGLPDRFPTGPSQPATKKTGGFHGFHRPGRLSFFPMRPVLCSLCLGSSGVSPPLAI